VKNKTSFPWQKHGRTRWASQLESYRGANLLRELWRQWNNRKHGASKLRFSHAKGFSENFLKLGLEASNFRQLCPRRKTFEESVWGASKLISCQWRQTLNLPEAPTCIRPVSGQRCGDDEVTVLVYESTKPYCGQAFLMGMTHCTGVINSLLGKNVSHF
jgi:hypothetical protein